MSYSSYDHDDLELASTMRIERRIYFESGKADLSEMVKLPLAELLSLRAESAAAEQEVFDRLKEQAAAWEEQAGKTLFWTKPLNMPGRFPSPTLQTSGSPDDTAISAATWFTRWITPFPRTPGMTAPPKNPFPTRGHSAGAFIPTRLAETGGKRSPDRIGKSFASREELDKYLNGRIKAHEHYFTEISPAIPKEYADCFKVNGCLLPATPSRGGTGKDRRASHTGGSRTAADRSHPGRGNP